MLLIFQDSFVEVHSYLTVKVYCRLLNHLRNDPIYIWQYLAYNWCELKIIVAQELCGPRVLQILQVMRVIVQQLTPAH